MKAIKLLSMLLFARLAGCASGQGVRAHEPFDSDQIRAAERRVTAALVAPDVTAWVHEYTEDALLLEPGSAPVSGRAALLELARSMKPITSGTISSDHIEGSGNVAYSLRHRDLDQWATARRDIDDPRPADSGVAQGGGRCLANCAGGFPVTRSGQVELTRPGAADSISPGRSPLFPGAPCSAPGHASGPTADGRR